LRFLYKIDHFSNDHISKLINDAVHLYEQDFKYLYKIDHFSNDHISKLINDAVHLYEQDF